MLCSVCSGHVAWRHPPVPVPATTMLRIAKISCISQRALPVVFNRSPACGAVALNTTLANRGAPACNGSRAASTMVTQASAQSDAPTSSSSHEDVPSTNGNVIYSNPELYEAAFSYRDFKQEARFIWSAYKKHSGSSTPPRTILDLGCGPAAHALLLAASYSNLTVVGLEANADMLAYAQKKLGAASSKLAAGSQVVLLQGDMREPHPAPPAPLPLAAATSKGEGKGGKGAKGFGGSAKDKDKAASQPHESSSPAPSSSSSSSSSSSTSSTASVSTPGGQYDVVMCLLGTFTHMLTNKDAAAALRQVAASLQTTGLLLLELPHPGDLFDGTILVGDGGAEVWEVPMGGAGREGDADAKLMVEWGADFDPFDPVTQILERTVSINLLRGEEVVQGLEEVVAARQFTVQELSLLAEGAGLELVTLYGDMSQGVDLTHEDAYRMVAVFRKAGAA